jgi:hypothetical protein
MDIFCYIISSKYVQIMNRRKRICKFTHETQKCGGFCRRKKGNALLFAERLAVGALVHGRICLMGAHHNTLQGAVIFSIAMVGALLHSAGDTLVGMGVHISYLLCFGLRR